MTFTAGRPDRRGVAPALDWLNGPPATAFRLVLSALYAAHIVVGLAGHAMWRDEIQAWLIARDSASLSELIGNLAYEGHPLGWYLILWPLTWLGSNPELMQVAQATFALAVAGLLIWRGPFSRIEIVLILLSYPFLFEYALKSRSYVLGCALLFLFCEAFSRRWPPIALALLMALLWNVHALFGIASVGCFAAVVARRIEERGQYPVATWQDGPALGLLVLGIVAAAAVAMPPPDSGFAMGWRLDLHYAHVRSTAQALGAVISGKPINGLTPLVPVAGGLAILATALVRWRAAPSAAAFLASSMFATAAFLHVKLGTNVWHRAVLFVILIASVWLARAGSGPGGRDLLPRWLFVLMLVPQAAVGVKAVADDRIVAYSAGRETAAALRAAGLQDAPVFAINDYAASPVVAYLEKQSAFYGPGMRDGSFVVWDQKRLEPVDPKKVVDKAASQARAVVLDCASDMPEGGAPDPRLVELGRYAGQSESCVIYQVRQP